MGALHPPWPLKPHHFYWARCVTTGLIKSLSTLPFQNSMQVCELAIWRVRRVRARSRFVSVRLLYLAVVRVFDWLVFLGRGQASECDHPELAPIWPCFATGVMVHFRSTPLSSYS